MGWQLLILASIPVFITFICRIVFDLKIHFQRIWWWGKIWSREVSRKTKKIDYSFALYICQHSFGMRCWASDDRNLFLLLRSTFTTHLLLHFFSYVWLSSCIGSDSHFHSCLLTLFAISLIVTVWISVNWICRDKVIIIVLYWLGDTHTIKYYDAMMREGNAQKMWSFSYIVWENVLKARFAWCCFVKSPLQSHTNGEHVTDQRLYAWRYILYS